MNLDTLETREHLIQNPTKVKMRSIYLAISSDHDIANLKGFRFQPTPLRNNPPTPPYHDMLQCLW